MSPITYKYQDMVESGLMYNGISLNNLLLSSEGATFRAKGKQKVRGRDAYVVKVTRDKKQPVHIFIDAEIFMWVRTEFGHASVTKDAGSFANHVENQGAGEAVVDFHLEISDFKELDELMLPFKFEQTVTAPILRERSTGKLTGVITEYRPITCP